MANNRHANAKAFRARLKIDGSRYSYANNLQPNMLTFSLTLDPQSNNKRRKKIEGGKKNKPSNFLL